MLARAAEQAGTGVTHTPHGTGICLEVVLMGFGWVLAAFSPYKNADVVFDFSCQLLQGTEISAGPPVIQKLKCLSIEEPP